MCQSILKMNNRYDDPNFLPQLFHGAPEEETAACSTDVPFESVSGCSDFGPRAQYPCISTANSVSQFDEIEGFSTPSGNGRTQNIMTASHGRRQAAGALSTSTSAESRTNERPAFMCAPPEIASSSSRTDDVSFNFMAGNEAVPMPTTGASFTDEETRVLSNMQWEEDNEANVNVDDEEFAASAIFSWDPMPLSAERVDQNSDTQKGARRVNHPGNMPLPDQLKHPKHTNDVPDLGDFLSFWGDDKAQKTSAQHCCDPSPATDPIPSVRGTHLGDVPCNFNEMGSVSLAQLQPCSSIERALRECEDETRKQKRMQYALSILTNPNRGQTRELVKQTAHDASRRRHELVFRSLLGATDAGGNLNWMNQPKSLVPNDLSRRQTIGAPGLNRSVVPLPASGPPTGGNGYVYGANRDHVLCPTMRLGKVEKKLSPQTSATWNVNLINGTFPQQLMNILSEEDDTQRTISWLPDGEGFAILDRAALVSDVLPRHYFKEVKLESFIRKLNRWGFQRAKSDNKNAIVYRHKLFKRGCPDLCSRIRIKTGSESR